MIATETTTNCTTMEWHAPETPNGAIDGYEISIARSGTGHLNWSDIGSNQSSFKACNLVSGTRYTVLFSAYNLDKESHRLRSRTVSANFSTGNIAHNNTVYSYCARQHSRDHLGENYVRF